jgi:selenocysteine lyase/cysteine desulfurase
MKDNCLDFDEWDEYFDGGVIYLDHNATTPIEPEVSLAMQPYLFTHWGNCSSPHVYGLYARKILNQCRETVANCLGCRTQEIVFTSGGTEANNLALKGVANAYKGHGNHIVTTTIEHPSVIEVCKFLSSKSFRVTYVPVDENGIVNMRALENAITKDTILVSVMHVLQLPFSLFCRCRHYYHNYFQPKSSFYYTIVRSVLFSLLYTLFRRLGKQRSRNNSTNQRNFSTN